MAAKSPRIVIAPAPWKGTFGAREVAEALAEGVRDVIPDGDIVLVPIADGGEGTGDALMGSSYSVAGARPAHDPLGRPVQATWYSDRAGRMVLVEAAGACGLPLLALGERDPSRANSAGLADLLTGHASRVISIVVAIGGTGTVDGATGCLRALGARLLDGSGHEIRDPNPILAEVAAVDLDGLDAGTLALPVSLMLDVDAPLLGPNGAAHAFGPQKGAGPDLVVRLEGGMARWADALAAATGRDPRHGPAGMGAGGGLAGGLWSVFGAECEFGANAVIRSLGLDGVIGGADLVISGEGRIDATTRQHKAPAVVAELAHNSGVPVAWVVGGAAAGVEPPHGGMLELAVADGVTADLEAIRAAGRRVAERFLAR